MSDRNDLLFDILAFGAYAFLVIGWIWTVVLAFVHKHFGFGILFVFIGILTIFYAIRFPVRCRIPLAMFVSGIALGGIAIAIYTPNKP
jgi:hypothetical protein